MTYDKLLPFKKYLISLPIIVIWIYVIENFAKGNINNQNLWFDESGQFWMAKGLSHYSPAFEANGGLWKVLENNAKFNLDPGGFTVLLHYWTMVSSNPIFLRSFPYAMFVLSMIVVSKLSIIWNPKNPLSYFSGFVLLTSPLLCEYAFELRPYSMEMLSAIVALFYCYKIPEILNVRAFALSSGILMALLLSSRYSAVFPVVALGIVILYYVIRNNFQKKELVNLAIFALPIVCACAFIYVFTLRNQNPGGTPPSYVQEIMFKTGDFSKILFNWSVFHIVLPLLIVALILLYSVIDRRVRPLLERYYIFFAYSVILNIQFIILSILGLYPWGITYRWDIACHSIFIISSLPVLFFIGDILTFKKSFFSKSLQFVILIVFLEWSFHESSLFRYVSLDSTYENITANNLSSDASVLINAGAYPTIRYLFEYGPLRDMKDNKIYRNVAIFDHPGYTNVHSIHDFDNIDKYDYIILTHFDYNNSEIIKILSEKPNWTDESVKKPARIYKNNK